MTHSKFLQEYMDNVKDLMVFFQHCQYYKVKKITFNITENDVTLNENVLMTHN